MDQIKKIPKHIQHEYDVVHELPNSRMTADIDFFHGQMHESWGRGGGGGRGGVLCQMPRHLELSRSQMPGGL